MNREIKFRVWNEREKTYEDGWNYFISDDGQIYALKYGALVNMSGVDYLKVEYSTGLKDKNGREIWEWDIVSAPAYQIAPRCEVVKFEPSSCGFEPFANSSYCQECWAPHADEVEVIGNIHENPELLGIAK